MATPWASTGMESGLVRNPPGSPSGVWLQRGRCLLFLSLSWSPTWPCPLGPSLHQAPDTNPRLLPQHSVSSVLSLGASIWGKLSPAPHLPLPPWRNPCLSVLWKSLRGRETCVPQMRSAPPLCAPAARYAEADAQPQPVPQLCSGNAPLHRGPWVGCIVLARFLGGRERPHTRNGPRPQGA